MNPKASLKITKKEREEVRKLTVDLGWPEPQIMSAEEFINMHQPRMRKIAELSLLYCWKMHWEMHIVNIDIAQVEVQTEERRKQQKHPCYRWLVKKGYIKMPLFYYP